jgi:hypothetical protein
LALALSPSPADTRRPPSPPSPPPHPRPQLQTQTEAANAAAAAAAAGGSLLPYNPSWAPWPRHSWPDSKTAATAQATTNAVAVQEANAASIASLQAQMRAYGC